jgi:hypothetical protein
MKKALATILLVVSFLSVSSLGFSATYYVPDNYATIQAALNGAAAGDEIIVRDGVYRGAGNKDLDFGGKALTLRSEHGADRCFIDCEGSGRGFDFSSGESADSVLDGFSIINGSATYGGGIYCSSSSSPTITNCSIMANYGGNYGGGIYCSSSSPTIINCSIAANTANEGGGVYCLSSSPTITDCSIRANRALSYGGGISCNSSSSPTITNCSIMANNAVLWGGGIECYSSSPTITNCSITANNGGGSGGGIDCDALSSPAITNCSFTANTVSDGGGGIFCSDSSMTITNCSFTANTAGFGGDGGGIYFFNSSMIITNCLIMANTAGSGGGLYCDLSSPTITNCSITANIGSATFFDTSFPVITNCILWNDSPHEIDYSGSVVTVTYSAVEGGYPGTGNIDADPLFSGDGYHLTAGSPCIDTGTDTGVSDDIDGDARPMGAGYDMGCDEAVSPPVISYTPSSLATSCLQGTNALPQGLAVWNSGSGTLTYSISDDAGWLSCTPASGTSTGEVDSITVNYLASGLAPGSYTATITISDSAASNNPQYVSVELTVTSDQLTTISLVAPASESVLSSPPTFLWGADGGTNNVFAVDLSLSYPITGYWSTYENLGLLITDQSWALSESLWNSIPSGSFVYWRVRGVNLDSTPLNIVYGDYGWWFYKQ